MILFLKSFNQEDRNICQTFLPGIADNKDSLFSEYQNLKNSVFALNLKMMRQKMKSTKKGKENRLKNRTRIFNSQYGSGFKSLLNSAKFLKKQNLATNNSKIDKELYQLCKIFLFSLSFDKKNLFLKNFLLILLFI